MKKPLALAISGSLVLSTLALPASPNFGAVSRAETTTETMADKYEPYFDGDLPDPFKVDSYFIPIRFEGGNPPEGTRITLSNANSGSYSYRETTRYEEGARARLVVPREWGSERDLPGVEVYPHGDRGGSVRAEILVEYPDDSFDIISKTFVVNEPFENLRYHPQILVKKLGWERDEYRYERDGIYIDTYANVELRSVSSGRERDTLAPGEEARFLIFGRPWGENPELLPEGAEASVLSTTPGWKATIEQDSLVIVPPESGSPENGRVQIEVKYSDSSVNTAEFEFAVSEESTTIPVETVEDFLNRDRVLVGSELVQRYEVQKFTHAYRYSVDVTTIMYPKRSIGTGDQRIVGYVDYPERGVYLGPGEKGIYKIFARRTKFDSDDHGEFEDYLDLAKSAEVEIVEAPDNGWTAKLLDNGMLEVSAPTNSVQRSHVKLKVTYEDGSVSEAHISLQSALTMPWDNAKSPKPVTSLEELENLEKELGKFTRLPSESKSSDSDSGSSTTIVQDHTTTVVQNYTTTVFATPEKEPEPLEDKNEPAKEPEEKEPQNRGSSLDNVGIVAVIAAVLAAIGGVVAWFLNTQSN